MRLIYALFSIIILHLPMVASADYLDVQISELTKQKQEKIKILEECQKNNKGFKIAGLATLGVSAIGIGVNIGEAVKIKNQQEDIADMNRRKKDLDDQMLKIAEDNTCGPSDCQGDGDDEAAKLNGKSPVCIKNVWAVKECKSGFKGNPQECKRKGSVIRYYEICTQDPSYNTCGSDVCQDVADLDALGAKSSVCINGQWMAQECKDNYTGTRAECKRNGLKTIYYEGCKEDTCGSGTCQGVADLNALGAKSSVCINGQWMAQECKDNYTGTKEECTSKGKTVSYYRECIPNMAPEGVITLLPSSATINAGDTVDFAITGTNIENCEFTLESENQSVATAVFDGDNKRLVHVTTSSDSFGKTKIKIIPTKTNKCNVNEIVFSLISQRENPLVASLNNKKFELCLGETKEVKIEAVGDIRYVNIGNIGYSTKVETRGDEYYLVMSIVRPDFTFSDGESVGMPTQHNDYLSATGDEVTRKGTAEFEIKMKTDCDCPEDSSIAMGLNKNVNVNISGATCNYQGADSSLVKTAALDKNGTCVATSCVAGAYLLIDINADYWNMQSFTSTSSMGCSNTCDTLISGNSSNGRVCITVSDKTNLNIYTAAANSNCKDICYNRYAGYCNIKTAEIEGETCYCNKGY